MCLSLCHVNFCNLIGKLMFGVTSSSVIVKQCVFNYHYVKLCRLGVGATDHMIVTCHHLHLIYSPTLLQLTMESIFSEAPSHAAPSTLSCVLRECSVYCRRCAVPVAATFSFSFLLTYCMYNIILSLIGSVLSLLT